MLSHLLRSFALCLIRSINILTPHRNVKPPIDTAVATAYLTYATIHGTYS
jgi:hypothetical protein